MKQESLLPTKKEPRTSMSDRQSQAHSTHQPSLNDQLKKVLRLNRDHKDVIICLMTGYREHIEK